MALAESPRPPDTVPPSSDQSGCSSDASRVGRLSNRWALLAVVLCPCHLWIVPALLGLFGAGAAAAAIRDNQTLLTIVLVPVAALALWRAYRLACRAGALRAAGASCSPR